MRSVPAIDASAMRSLRDLAARAKKKHITLIFSHVNEQPMSVMKKDHFIELIGEGQAEMETSTEDAEIEWLTQ